MLDNFDIKIKHQTFDAGELIPLQSDSFWLLQRGAVKTCAWTREGNPMTLGYWGRNDLIVQALSMVHPYKAKCLTAVDAICIPLNKIDNVADLILGYNQQNEEFLYILRAEKIYQRLRRMLLWLAQKFGERIEIGQLIELRLTHQDLAEVIGATRVSVTKLINQLEREGFLSRPERNTLVIHG